jgi:hypothetical protein
MDNFIFVELGTGLPSFDGMSAGAFTDMRGKKVEFKPDELMTYITNTKEILESTRSDSGELVGLPIDLDGHDHKGGAGWITDVTLDSARNIIRFGANWTQAGTDLIKGNVRRFFSPTVDPSEKVILGGSMTNWPASRDKKGRMMLRPIELSEQIQEIEMTNEFTLDSLRELGKEFVALFKASDKPANPTQEIQEVEEKQAVNMAEFMQTPEAIAELEKRATERAAELLKAEQLKMKVADFSAKLTGGTIALAMKADELTADLLSFTDAEKVMEFVGKIMEAKLVDFQEHGTSGTSEVKQTLPETLKPYMQTWVAAGNTPESFFTVNPEIGLASDYELAEFTKEK